MTWTHKGQVVESIDITKYKAFVYLITNNITGQKYIGMKQTVFAKTRQVKGKKKRFSIESDWRDYWSSSEELKRDVVEYGGDNFTREILYFCPNKGTANYLEAREQFDQRVLEHPDKFYNGIINVRVHKCHIKIQQ